MYIDRDQYIRDWRERQKIKCPYCNHEYDFTSEDMGMVTYWGEDGPQELTCDNCDKGFFADEHVDRTFTVGKTYDTARKW
jgi:redox-regulated HSP33 family molecular chaperone